MTGIGNERIEYPPDTRMIIPEEYDCPQCGYPTDTLYEGHCRECCDENQLRLDLHNAELDQWERLSDRERELLIKLENPIWSNND